MAKIEKTAKKANGIQPSHQFIMALRERIETLELQQDITRIRCDHAIRANEKFTEDNRRLNQRITELTKLIEKDNQGKLAFRRVNMLEGDVATLKARNKS